MWSMFSSQMTTILVGFGRRRVADSYQVQMVQASFGSLAMMGTKSRAALARSKLNMGKELRDELMKD